jgi:hypothetical protein
MKHDRLCSVAVTIYDTALSTVIESACRRLCLIGQVPYIRKRAVAEGETDAGFATGLERILVIFERSQHGAGNSCILWS